MACVAAVAATPVQGTSDNQASHLALIRAFSGATTQIDRYAMTTDDKVRFRGHFYSNKAPGLALASLPAYAAFEAAGGPAASRRVAQRSRDRDRGTTWAVGLAGAVLPALAVLLLVQRLGDRIEPGRGAAAAVTLGLATLLLPFSTMLFAHALSALLAFTAFAALWREREGEQRLLLVAAAGLAAGLAVSTEYTLAVVAFVLGIYAVLRDRETRSAIRRAAAFAGGAAAGVVPLLAYNALAFGSPLHVSYDGVEAQSAGLFGVRPPRPDIGLDIMVGHKGLLVMSPVLVAAVAGVALMARRGLRAEAFTIAGVAGALLLVNAGFYLDDGAPGAPDHPFGGFSPGPRLLVPMLPFLALGLACAYRRAPLLTALLAVFSAARVMLATLTEPLVDQDTGVWWDRLAANDFTATVFTQLLGGNGWPTVTPVLVLAAAAAALAIVAARKAGAARSRESHALTGHTQRGVR